MGYAAASAAHGKRRAQHHRITQIGHDAERIVQRVRVSRPSGLDSQLGHALVEELSILAALDGRQVAADHLNPVGIQHARLRQLDGRVQAGLAAQGGQQGIGALLLYDLLDELGSDGLDVGAVGQARIGHDGGRIAVHQNHVVAVRLEHLARLRARIVELARLADDDRAGPDDQDGLDVRALRHDGLLPSQRTTSRQGGRRRCRCRGSSHVHGSRAHRPRSSLRNPSSAKTR